MEKLTCFVIVIVFVVCAGAQSPSVVRIDTSRQSVLHWSKWADDLYEMGVQGRNDSFFVRQEVVRLMKDEDYRHRVYPAKYEWPVVTQLMQQMELKKAFWHLINLYQSDTSNRKVVLGTFILYDSLLEMDKIVLSTFYTYAFADPRVCRVVNGRPDIYRPDILEKGLAAAKEITGYIWAYRKQKLATKSK